MSMEPPHMPDEEDHLFDALSEDDPLTDRVVSLIPRDEEAFANELESLRPNGIRVATPILHSKHEAEDVVDAVIAKLFINGIPYGASHEKWFIHCVQNAALDRIKSAPWRTAQRDADTILAKALSEVETPLEQALANQRIETIQAALLQLAFDDREILRLRFFEDLHIEEIARRCNVPKGTLYSRLQRAIEQLEKILKKGGKINV